MKDQMVYWPHRGIESNVALMAISAGNNRITNMTKSCLASVLMALVALPVLTLLSLAFPALTSITLVIVAIWATLHGLGLAVNALACTPTGNGGQQTMQHVSPDAPALAEGADEEESDRLAKELWAFMDQLFDILRRAGFGTPQQVLKATPEEIARGIATISEQDKITLPRLIAGSLYSPQYWGDMKECILSLMSQKGTGAQ
jgi:hypothetical protein